MYAAGMAQRRGAPSLQLDRSQTMLNRLLPSPHQRSRVAQAQGSYSPPPVYLPLPFLKAELREERRVEEPGVINLARQVGAQ